MAPPVKWNRTYQPVDEKDTSWDFIRGKAVEDKGTGSPLNRPPSLPPPLKKSAGLLPWLTAREEGLLHGVTSAAAFPVSGLAGLHELIGLGLHKLKPMDGPEPDVLRRMQSTMETLTHHPATEEGQQYIQEKSEAPSTKALDWLTRQLPEMAGEKLQDWGAPAPLAGAAVGALELLPNLVGGRKPTKGLAGIPWERMALEEARGMAQRGEHLKRGSGGHYTGAPEHVTSPQALSAMRGGLDKSTEQGAFGADWYDKARAAIKEMSGEDPAKADKLSKMLALYSPQADPSTTNPMRAFSQINDIVLKGDESKLKPFYGYQAEKGRQIMAGGNPELGPKVGTFEEHINPNKAEQAKTRGVNDVWMGRAFGYPMKRSEGRGFRAAEHSFMTGENLLTAERAKAKGILPDVEQPDVGNVQAATWTGERYKGLLGQKGNSELSSKLHASGDLEKALELDARLKRQATSNYGDYPSGHEPYELIPGRGTGHMSGATELPYGQKEKLSRELDWKSPEGRDPLYEAAGMYQRPTLEGKGSFTEKVTRRELEPALRDPQSGEVYRGGMHHGDTFMLMPQEAQERMPERNPQGWRGGDWAGFWKNPEGKFLTRSEASKLRHPEGWGYPMAAEELWGRNPKIDMEVTDHNPNRTARPMLGNAESSLEAQRQVNAFRTVMDAQSMGAYGHKLDPVTGFAEHTQEPRWSDVQGGVTTDWLLNNVSPRMGELLHKPGVSEALNRKNVAELSAGRELPVNWPREDLQRLRGMTASLGLEGVRAAVKKAGGGVAGAAKLGLPAWLLATSLTGEGAAE